MVRTISTFHTILFEQTCQCGR